MYMNALAQHQYYTNNHYVTGKPFPALVLLLDCFYWLEMVVQLFVTLSLYSSSLLFSSVHISIFLLCCNY